MPFPTDRPPVSPDLDRKPRDEEIDVFGLTHPGKVRPTNQDHFLLASIHRRLDILQTSLTDQERLRFPEDRIAFLAMIADGVGGTDGGGEASRLALETATQYITESVNSYRSSAAGTTFENALQDAAMVAHAAVAARLKEEPDLRSMATTLTLWLGVWPWYYLLQVGDSRYYLYREGTLTQITRDQTMAQDLVDQGVLKRADADKSRLAHVLSSAIGGPNTMPVVTRLRADWQNVHLLCSDGLFKHVTDDQIAERLRTMTSAKQVAEQLLQDALDGGGSDNISIIVGQAKPKGDA
ncbi:MAG TPA: protein phosphatase 2C domain-containing protein [Gemmatimonadales bacterium]|nr:protein phosphatase 2C domain-containing protein [Gemmatimonadales bacterium]